MMHKEKPSYGTTGEVFVSHIAKLAEESQAKSILDYGCGKRTLESGLLKLWMGVPLVPIINYDPAIEGCDEKKPCDLVVCTDVLEHIEPEYLGNVLHDIQGLMNKVGYFTVHTEPALKHLSDGRNAHLIQKPYGWWFQKLSEAFWVSKMFNLGSDVFFTVARSKETAVDYAYKSAHMTVGAVGQRW
jgi:methyltransferase family protein